MNKYTLLIGFILLVSFKAFSQNEKMKAVFIYNFTKYISWPESESQGSFKIGVLASSALSKELKLVSQQKTVGTRKIEVLEFSNANAIKSCHLLVIPSSSDSQIESVISKVSAMSVVVIADSDGAIDKGAGINFRIVDGKQKFEIRKRNIEKKGIKVNSALINLGISK